ncbi:TPR domain protein [Penicillium hispanicum]|uniref:TPR domain protein n=1 Tax=Penicillium hispanicum TaxID=1080232 RepID=UPI002540BF7D|nr:TPR domain protein [Penicillium hispanicum]KAJ5570095.1 TPR domain protein [Penicillium hispanicum]
MDTHDVSDVPEYLQHLQGQRRMLQQAQSRKGQRLRATKSREEILMMFMLQRMRADVRPSAGYPVMRSSFVPAAYPPCIVPLEALSKVLIRDLTLETHHRGSYIVLRAVTPVSTITAAMCIMEDEDNQVLVLQLYNQDSGIATDGRLVKDTILLVKEPYLRVMADGDTGIRVDHLSDITFLPDGHDLIPLSWRQRVTEEDLSVNDWKMKGNNFFNRNSFHLAVECYSRALKSSPTDQETLTITLNRALAFLKTHQFDAALRDLAASSSSSEPPEKGLFRRSQALYHLQRFRESCDTHKELLRKFPQNTEAKEEFNRAIARLMEQERGKYQFKRLQQEASKRRPPLLDRATYVGPVAIRATQSQGRGLFTTKAVKAGDLLFCEKAFAYAFFDEDDPTQGPTLLINPQTNTMTIGTQAELIGALVRKLYKNPSLASSFTDLYHGEYEPVNVLEIDGVPVVDTFLAERIMSLNCFGCPLMSRESHLRLLQEKSPEEGDRHDFKSCGLWTLASHINHSCNTNARRSFIGDMMVVRATRDLAPDTEITFWYKSPSDNTPGKPLELQHWGFTCSCIICHDIQETDRSNLAKRRRLEGEVLKAWKTLHSHQNPKTTKIEALLLSLAETYRQPASDVPRLGHWRSYLNLAMLSTVSHQPQKAVGFALKALESLGYIIEGGCLPHTPGTPLLVRKWGLADDGLVGCWMCLARAYRTMAPDLEAQAQEYARLAYKMCVGEDETFNETYGMHSARADGLIARARRA